MYIDLLLDWMVSISLVRPVRRLLPWLRTLEINSIALRKRAAGWCHISDGLVSVFSPPLASSLLCSVCRSPTPLQGWVISGPMVLSLVLPHHCSFWLTEDPWSRLWIKGRVFPYCRAFMQKVVKFKFVSKLVSKSVLYPANRRLYMHPPSALLGAPS